MRYFEFVTVASISLLLVLSTYLITRASPNGGSFRWIGVFLLLLAINFADGLLSLNGFYLDHPRLAGWEEGFVLLYGPSMLFFAYSVTDPPFRWSASRWVHLVPFLIAEVALVASYQSLSAEEKLFILEQATSMQPTIWVFAIQLAVVVHVLTYTLIARRIIQNHEEALKQNYSTRVVRWARLATHYLIGLFAMSLVAMLTLQAGYPGLYLIGVLIVVASTGLFTFYVLLKALDQPLLLAAPQRTAEHSLPDAEIEQLAAKIRNFFEVEQGYTNPDLTVGDLAEQLAEPVRDVSHVVNHHLARNFYDLVNTYRVQAAAEIFSAETESTVTVTEVMYEVGFSSKSSFNTQFKKKTGLTPSEYRNKRRSGG